MKSEGKKALRNKASGKKPVEQGNTKRSESQQEESFGKGLSDANTALHNVISLIKNVKELGVLVWGIACYLKGERLLSLIAFAVIAAMVFFQVVKRIGHKGAFAAAGASIVIFFLVLVPCLLAFGFVQFNPHPEKQEDGEHAAGKDANNNADDSEELETVASTESPILTYKEMTFEDKIASDIWLSFLSVVENAENAWTEEGFEALEREVFGCMENLASVEESRNAKKHHTEAIRKNVDEITDLERERSSWKKFTRLSVLRAENYMYYPSLENAHQSGIAALDCLDWMGKVNGKEGKELNTSIYNEDHALEYGERAVDGFFGWWCMELKASGAQKADEICFYYGQTFHHFGGYNDMTGDRVAVEHLLLSAVFYCRVAVDDENLYRSGQASEKQYLACLYVAVVFDKLDNKLRPEDSFFLKEAEKYYRYASYNSNLSTDMADKIEKYIEIVKEKKRNRIVQK